jgi:hypothetical protein
VAISVHVVLAAFAVPAALTAAYVWFFVLKIPLERPVDALFGNARIPREGWAAWYVAPLVAFTLTYAVFWLYFRKTRRWTVLGFALAGTIAIVFGNTLAFWTKTVGYQWYYGPGDIAASVHVLWPMFKFSFGRVTHVLMVHAPLIFAAGALFSTVVALVLDLPWRCQQPAPPTRLSALAFAPNAGRIGRIATTVLMTLFVIREAAAAMPFFALAVAPLAALAWWFLSFRGGRYDFINVLMGSALLALISALPLFLALATRGYQTSYQGFDPATLALGFMTRAAVYLLASVVMIRVTLVLSRVADKLLTKTPFLRRAALKPTASSTPLPVPQAGIPGRLVTVVIMTLVITNDAKAGMSGMAAIVALLVALIWWFVSFHRGRSGFGNMLAGSALHALIVTIASQPFWRGGRASLNPFPDAGWGLESAQRTMAIELVTRTGAYLLVAFLMIRITLALPRVAEKVRRRLSG